MCNKLQIIDETARFDFDEQVNMVSKKDGMHYARHTRRTEKKNKNTFCVFI